MKKFVLYLFGFFLCSLALCYFVINQISPLQRIQELEQKVENLERVVATTGTVLEMQDKALAHLAGLAADTIEVIKESSIIDREKVWVAGKCNTKSCKKFTGIGGP